MRCLILEDVVRSVPKTSCYQYRLLLELFQSSGHSLVHAHQTASTLMLSPAMMFPLLSTGLHVFGGVHHTAPDVQRHEHSTATHTTGLDSSSSVYNVEWRALRHLTNTQGRHTTLTPAGYGFTHLIGQARAAAQMDNAKSTPGPAPSFAVNEAAYISTWAPSWAQQEEGSKCALLSYPPGNDYVFHVAPASGRCSRREDPFAEAGGLLWLKLVFKLMICALGAASLVGKSKPRR